MKQRRSKEYRKKLSLALKGKPLNHKSNCACCICKAKRGEGKGEKNPFYGRKHTLLTRQKMKANQPDRRGEKNGRYLGGLSFQKYGEEFDNILKEQIRCRDNYRCQVCNKSQFENGRNLSIHHIDYNKRNYDINNLISLCCSCHSKTNINRKKWKKFFTEKHIKFFGQYLKEVNIEFLVNTDLDIDETIKKVDRLVNKIGMKITQKNPIIFGNGMDIYYGLKESILYFGYWGEYHYIKILISSCKNYSDSTVKKIIEKLFSPSSEIKISVHSDKSVKTIVEELKCLKKKI